MQEERLYLCGEERCSDGPGEHEHPRGGGGVEGHQGPGGRDSCSVHCRPPGGSLEPYNIIPIIIVYWLYTCRLLCYRQRCVVFGCC